MSRPFITTCPYCHEQVEIPYTKVFRHTQREQGHRRFEKHPEHRDPEYMRNMIKKRWENEDRSKLHPKEEAILELSKQENINNLTLKRIAEKVHIEGRWQERYVRRYLDNLQNKGLLPVTRRMPYRAHVLPGTEN